MRVLMPPANKKPARNGSLSDIRKSISLNTLIPESNLSRMTKKSEDGEVRFGRELYSSSCRKN
jgi:hypothetical protein